MVPLLFEGRVTSQYGNDWPLHCPSCDSIEGALVSYNGPAPFVIKTVKGDLTVLTDMLELTGKTIGTCNNCDHSAPLEDWIYVRGIGNRQMWYEPDAKEDEYLKDRKSWFNE